MKYTDYGVHAADFTAAMVVIPETKEDGDVPSKQEELHNENYLKHIIAN